MLTFLSLCIALLFVLLFVLHLVATGALVVVLFRYRSSGTIARELPAVSILLSLRGADPYLAVGLRRLMTQNYPRYEIRIAVDHPDDPAKRVVDEAMAETGFERAHVMVVQERRGTCSVKCSALIELVASLDKETEVIAQADADLVSHDDWLRDLVVQLDDEGVGACYGNRWFWPKEARWGSLVRYLWNAAAVVPMYWFQIPWGGTFAIKRTVLERTNLVAKWSRAVVEDAPIRAALDQCGLRARFVPRLMMVNREDCGLPFSLDFIKRQLTWTRLYHPRWFVVLLHAIFISALPVAAVACGAAALVVGDDLSAAWSLGGVAFHWFSLSGLLLGLEVAVRHVVRSRGDETAAFSWWVWPKVLLAMPLTQAVYVVAVAMAWLRRRVAWRGIVYHLHGPWDIEVVDYQAYSQPEETSNNSL